MLQALRVRRLDPILVDRIAAGEVVERPASAIKELVENSLDAGATRIDVRVEGAGKTLIRVTDDGFGMTAEDLALCIERNASSKLPDGDLTNIATFGFRGEALPSIASVSRLDVTSRARGSDMAHVVSVDCGRVTAVRPASRTVGTTVEVRDLFCATPARLAFLKGDRAELAAISDVLRRVSLANLTVHITLSTPTGGGFDDLPCAEDDEGRLTRVSQVVGDDFLANAVPLDARRREVAGRDAAHLTGFVGLPTHHRATADSQYFFVNGRPVRDKLLAGAVAGAYMDYVPKGRKPVVALFLTCGPGSVDVNVHPAKAEVRFRDADGIRGFVVGAIRDAITGMGHRTSSAIGERTLEAVTSTKASETYMGRPVLASTAAPRTPAPAQRPLVPQGGWASKGGSSGGASWSPPRAAPREPALTLVDHRSADVRQPSEPVTATGPDAEALPLGAARAQFLGTYILAQTADGIVIVDQHAAHERLVYERLKAFRAQGTVPTQLMLIPTVVDMSADEAACLLEEAETLRGLGLVLEKFGRGVQVVEVPSVIASGDIVRLVKDLAEVMRSEGTATPLERRLDHYLATFACHHSIRANRRMRPEEMDALLREIERTPGSGQCNHGRPTHVSISRDAIERMFERR